MSRSSSRLLCVDESPPATRLRVAAADGQLGTDPEVEVPWVDADLGSSPDGAVVYVSWSSLRGAGILECSVPALVCREVAAPEWARDISFASVRGVITTPTT